MKTKKDINQLAWINEYLHLRIRKKNIKSTLMFILYWNILEHLVCDDNFNINSIRQKISIKRLSQIDFIEYYTHFRHRYVSNGVVTRQFDLLMFRSENDKQYVKNCFQNNNPTDEEAISSLFLVIQRLRNNIFHGLKEIEVLEVQEPNFKNANAAIVTFLELIRNN